MSSQNRHLALLSVIGGLAIILPGVAPGQLGSLNAEFAGGGARALAMGGSFIALADDATASEFNPAGLWQLRRPEFALQGLYTWDKREVPLLGKTINEMPPGQTEPVPFYFDAEDQYFVPSFASFVYPFQHIVIGVSEFTNIYTKTSYEDESSSGTARYIEEQTANYAVGMTLATALTERLSVGTTLRYNFFRNKVEDAGETYRFEDEAPSANIGVLWAPHRLVQLGAVYKSTQDLDGSFGGYPIETELPDTVGAGIALFPDDSWRVCFDVDRIYWSKFDPDGGMGNDQRNFYKEDVWRYHAGAEYYLGYWWETAFFLRGGYMYEESNATQVEGVDPFWNALAKDPEPINHYTFGIGAARERYQVDLGLDMTEENGVDLILSGVWYF